MPGEGFEPPRSRRSRRVEASQVGVGTFAWCRCVRPDLRFRDSHFRLVQPDPVRFGPFVSKALAARRCGAVLYGRTS